MDVFISKERPFDQQQLARRIERRLDNEGSNTAYFASAEDTVLARLEWYRLGGEQSERQWLDILSILNLQKTNLDHDYLQKWAETLQVDDLLNRALAALS